MSLASPAPLSSPVRGGSPAVYNQIIVCVSRNSRLRLNLPILLVFELLVPSPPPLPLLVSLSPLILVSSAVVNNTVRQQSYNHTM